METQEQLELKLRVLEAVEEHLENLNVEDFNITNIQDRNPIYTVGQPTPVEVLVGRGRTRIVIDLS